jgi:hypothetical protein
LFFLFFRETDGPFVRDERRAPLLSNPRHGVVILAGHSILAVHTAAHHHDFPEVRPHEDAAAEPADLLARTLDCAPNDRRRQWLQQAIEHLQALVSRDRA